MIEVSCPPIRLERGPFCSAPRFGARPRLFLLTACLLPADSLPTGRNKAGIGTKSGTDTDFRKSVSVPDFRSADQLFFDSGRSAGVPLAFFSRRTLIS